MAYVRLSEEVVVTKEFYNCIINGFKMHYGTKPEGLKVEDLKYKSWDDSDQPGIDERLELRMNDGKEFRVAMTHNRWSNFIQIS